MISAVLDRDIPQLAALLILLVAWTSAQAFELDQIDVQHEGAQYEVHMQVRLNVSADAAYAVFSDIALLPQINPAIRKASVMRELPNGARRVYTQVHMCVALFCKQLHQVQDMRFEVLENGGTVRASVVPELSDLRFGEAAWSFRSCGEQACLRFHARMEPKFWVPPLIGPWLIQRKLQAEAMETSAGLEKLARAHKAKAGT